MAVVLVGYILFRSHQRVITPLPSTIDTSQITSANNLSDLLIRQSVDIMPEMQTTMNNILSGIIHDDESQLTASYRQAKSTASQTKQIKLNIHQIFEQ